MQSWIRFGDGLGAQLDCRVDTVTVGLVLGMDLVHSWIAGWIRCKVGLGLGMDLVHSWISGWIRCKVGLGLGWTGCMTGLQTG